MNNTSFECTSVVLVADKTSSTLSAFETYDCGTDIPPTQRSIFDRMEPFMDHELPIFGGTDGGR